MSNVLVLGFHFAIQLIVSSTQDVCAFFPLSQIMLILFTRPFNLSR